MPEALLAANGLHTCYGASHVLQGVDFRVEQGETVGLLGRNGMGKTTLIRSLLGLTPPRQGRLWVRGEDATGLPPHRLARLGLAYVPEGRGIFPNLSVKENLLLAARRGADGRCAWDLDRVLGAFPRLAQRLGHGGGQLSGGEQQMLSIGRALMTNPSLLFLDEATEGLAPLIAAEIWNLLREIRAAGVAAVIVDKNHRAVTRHADKAVLLAKGRVVFAGPAQDLADRPGLLQQHLGV